MKNLLFCLLLLCFPTLLQAQEESDRYRYFSLEAQRMMTQQRYDVALGLWQHCLAIAPDAPSALYGLSQCFQALRQPAEELSLLQRAVRLDPDNYWYAHALCSHYVSRDSVALAIRQCLDMTRRFPLRSEPFYALFDLYNRSGDYAGALRTLDTLEVRVGKTEPVTMEKLRCALRLGDKERALREVEGLVEQYPAEMRYQVILGDVCMQQGDSLRALRLYRDALRQEPDQPQARLSLASWQEMRGDTDAYVRQLDTLFCNHRVEVDDKLELMRRFAVAHERDSLRVLPLLECLSRQEPDDKGCAELHAQYLLTRGMRTQAVPVLQRLLLIDPTHTAARMTLLGEAVRTQDQEEVIRLCRGGVEASPEVLEFYFYLAVSYMGTDRDAEAVRVARQALEQPTDSENDRSLVSDLYGLIGDASHSLGARDDCYEAYRKALEYNPDNMSVLNNYAYYLSEERRDLDHAEEMSHKTVQAEPDNATYLDTYAWILYLKGDYTQARIYMDQAMQAGGEESEVLQEHCGDIYYALGLRDEALRYWQKSLQMGNESPALLRKIKRKKL